MGSITMKMLVTGGNRGLGQHLVNVFGADSVSRATNLDITDEQAVKLIAHQSLNYDVFVNNAFDGPPQEAWANFAQTNLYMAVYDKWKDASKSGHIFNISSIAGLQAYPNGGSYSISKFAMTGLSKALREELKNAGVKVTNVAPGATYTDSWASANLPESRFIQANDIAKLLFDTYNLSTSAVVEELVIRPILGDI